jgi:hypothetical protein
LFLCDGVLSKYITACKSFPILQFHDRKKAKLSVTPSFDAARMAMILHVTPAPWRDIISG